MVYYKKLGFWVSVVVGIVIVAGVSIWFLFNQPETTDSVIDAAQKEQTQTDKPINDNEVTQNTHTEEVEDENGVLLVSSVPKMTEENQMYYDRYIKDVAAVIPIRENFSKDDYFKTDDPYFMFGYAFSKEFGYSLGEEGKDKYDGFYPADLVESLISKYFVFDKEEIREIVLEKCTIIETEELPEDIGRYYNSTKEVFYFGKGGYVAWTPLSTVTRVEKKGDNRLFIDVANYVEYYNEEDVLQEGLQVYGKNVVEIELSDGEEPLSCGFKIAGNKVEYAAKNIFVGTPEIDLQTLVFKYEGEVLLCDYQPESEIYEEQAISFDECMSITGTIMDYMTAYDLLCIYSEKYNKEFPIKSIFEEDGIIFIDFSREFLAMYDKNEISAILNSLATTLDRNGIYSQLLLKVDGEEGLFSNGDNGEFEPAKFKLMEEPYEAQLKAVRAEIPYKMSGTCKVGYSDVDIDDFLFIEKTQEVEDVYDYLFRLGRINESIHLKPHSIYSPTDIDNDLFFSILITSTKICSTYQPYYDEKIELIAATMRNKLDNLGHQYLDGNTFWIKEHIEETARYFFGEDYVVDHQSFDGFLYFEEEGVYITPPTEFLIVGCPPYIHSYEEIGDEVKIEISYIQQGMGIYSYIDADGEWIEIPEADAIYHALNSAPRYEVTLNKTNDGGFKFVSSIMK